MCRRIRDSNVNPANVLELRQIPVFRNCGILQNQGFLQALFTAQH